MALTPTQRGFLTTIGVKERPKKVLHIASKDEKLDTKIIGVSDDYLRREAKVLEAVNELGQVRGTASLVAELEGEISQIQNRVTSASREEAAKTIERAYESLEAIKERARALAKSAGSNVAFYNGLDDAEKAIASLERHPHQDCVSAGIATARERLGAAQASAKNNKFDDAARILVESSAACTTARGVADNLKPLFERAAAAQLLLPPLAQHAQTGKIVAEIFNANAALRKFKTDATGGDVAAATISVAAAETACADGKAKADGFADFYPKVLLTTQKLGDLNKDPHKTEIAAQIGTATTELKTANDEAALHNLELAVAALGRADAACVLGKELAAIAAKVPPAKPALEELKKHPQRAHVAIEIAAAEQKFLLVAQKITAGDPPLAKAALEAAEKACADGKKFAEEYAKLVVLRASAGRAVAAVKPYDDTKAATMTGTMNAAMLKAAPPGRDYAGAKTDLEQVVTDGKDWANDNLAPPPPAPPDLDDIDKLAAKVATIKKTDEDKASKATFEADVAEIKTHHGAVVSNIAAGDLRQSVMAFQQKLGLMTSTEKFAERRLKYDSARAACVTEIDKLKSHKSLLGQIFSMQELLKKADRLATRDSLRFEDGIAELKDIETTCKQLVQVADDAEAYAKERTLADNELAGLTQNNARPAREAIAAQLASIDKLLLAATQATGSTNGASAGVG